MGIVNLYAEPVWAVHYENSYSFHNWPLDCVVCVVGWGGKTAFCEPEVILKGVGYCLPLGIIKLPHLSSHSCPGHEIYLLILKCAFLKFCHRDLGCWWSLWIFLEHQNPKEKKLSPSHFIVFLISACLCERVFLHACTCHGVDVDRGGQSVRDRWIQLMAQRDGPPSHLSDLQNLFVLIWFWERVSLCLPGWSETHFVGQASLELTETHLASAPQELRSKVCTSRPSKIFFFSLIKFIKAFLLLLCHVHDKKIIECRYNHILCSGRGKTVLILIISLKSCLQESGCERRGTAGNSQQS